MSNCPQCGRFLDTSSGVIRCNECLGQGTISYVTPAHPRCDCHQCTWLRASSIERTMMSKLPDGKDEPSR